MADADIKQSFLKFLRARGHRVTGERLEVLDRVLTSDGHFEADSLYLKMKTEGSTVSRATVYNTLGLLHESGIVSRNRFSQGYSQYEKIAGRPHHDHMICTRCGAIYEFESPRIRRLQDEVCRGFEFRPTYHSFQIFGLCKDCH